METPQPVTRAGTPPPGNENPAEVEIDVSSPNRDELLEIMSGLMIDYNAMTKCLEETTAALASAEQQASLAQQESQNLKTEADNLRRDFDEAQQQLSKRDSELQDCRIKLKWAQQSPRPTEEKSGFVTLSAMNEQLQIAATQGQREKQQRESLQKEVEQLKVALKEAKQQSKELQGKLTQSRQNHLVEERQKQEIQHARNRLASRKHYARQGKPEGTENLSHAQNAFTGKGTEASSGFATSEAQGTDVCPQMTPQFRDGGKAWEPLHPVVSDTSVPGNSASGCISQVTPGSTAATRMLSPLSGGAVNSSDVRPSPSERAQAVLARANRQDHSSPAQIPPPSNNTSLTEQPSLMPMASLLESASLAPQASAEEVRHAPSAVMCSQVWTSLAAHLSDQGRPEGFGGNRPPTTFARGLKQSPQKWQCKAIAEDSGSGKRSSHTSTSPTEHLGHQKQGSRPSSDRKGQKSPVKRQPWPLNKVSDERHIFKQQEGLDECDNVRMSMSCSPQLMPPNSEVADNPGSVGIAEVTSEISSKQGAPAAQKAADSCEDVVTSCTDSPSESHSGPGDSLFNLHKDVTVLSKPCGLDTSFQNENADFGWQGSAMRPTADALQAPNRAPLKESSDNFDPVPQLQKARSRTNAAVLEAAFEPAAVRQNSAGSLHSRSSSGQPCYSKRRQTTTSKRPSTTESRPAGRHTKWTPRSTITPSPAKGRVPLHSGGKSSSAQKRTDWKVPNRSRSLLAQTKAMPQNDMHHSEEFKIRASTGTD